MKKATQKNGKWKREKMLYFKTKIAGRKSRKNERTKN